MLGFSIILHIWAKYTYMLGYSIILHRPSTHICRGMISRVYWFIAASRGSIPATPPTHQACTHIHVHIIHGEGGGEALRTDPSGPFTFSFLPFAFCIYILLWYIPPSPPPYLPSYTLLNLVAHFGVPKIFRYPFQEIHTPLAQQSERYAATMLLWCWCGVHTVWFWCGKWTKTTCTS